jgi:dimethylsulfone monooxygenase
MIENFIAGYSALSLVGTPEQVVDGMCRMARGGFDGLTLSWVDCAKA